MANFTYTGRDTAGKLVKGKLDALDTDAVASQLVKNNITPIDIKSEETKFSLLKLLNKDIKSGRVKTEDLITFCRQMYTLTKSGVPILESLMHLLDATRSKTLSNSLRGIIDSISSGQTLTASLRKYPKIFPNVFVSITEAGENSGQLDATFLQLAEYLELESKTIKRIKAATRYPLLVIFAIVAALVVVNFVVVPAFSKLFKQFGGKLPLPTRILVATSNFFIHYWFFLLIGIIVLFFTARYLLKTPKGRYYWDKWKLKIPVVGSIMNRIVLARFTRTFSMMLASGVPLVQSVTLVANIVGNTYIRRYILAMRDGIEHGETLTKTATASGLFTPLVLQMLSVGEEAGSIDNMLKEVAEFYEREVDYDLKRLGDLIEPFLLLVMGTMVLILALGVFLPMWDMVQFAH